MEFLPVCLIALQMLMIPSQWDGKLNEGRSFPWVIVDIIMAEIDLQNFYIDARQTFTIIGHVQTDDIA